MRVIFTFVVIKFLIFCFCNESSLAQDLNCPTKKPIICYWASWAVYRPSKGSHNVKDILPEYCTHVVYSFAGINIDGNIQSLDTWNDLEKGGYKAALQLKQKNPCLKLLLAIGGWNEGSEKFSLAAESPESREEFSKRIIHFLIYYGFDGLDIDWEYPGTRGGIPDDKENFPELLKVLKAKLEKRNRILTAAVSASVWATKTYYDVKKICENLDFVSIMGYDLHNSSSTSMHSLLKLDADERSDMNKQTIHDVIKYYKDNGCPSEKIILGIPSYGRSFILKNKNQHSLNSPVAGVGNPGPYTREAGFLGFNEICEMQQKGSNKKKWKRVYRKENAAVYASLNDLWVSYDDPITVKQKMKYVVEEKLGGVMFWSIDTDDFHGNCYGHPYPLLAAANEVL